MTDLSSSLILTGDHPAALWLAPALARRGWQVLWAEDPERSRGAEGWWGLSHRVFEGFGEPVPAWPLELCAMPLDGLVRFRGGQLLEMMPWPGALIELGAYRRELEVELQALELLRAERSQLDGPAARLGDWQAAWCIEIDFCSGCGDQGRRSGVLAAAMPGGMLEMHSEMHGDLSLAGLAPGLCAWSYRPVDGVFREVDLWKSFKSCFPELGSKRHGLLASQVGCACLPRIESEGRSIRFVLPRPDLDPAGLVLAALGWMTAQALLRWLSEDLLRLDRLGLDSQAYLAKVLEGLASFRNSYTFLKIP